MASVQITENEIRSQLPGFVENTEVKSQELVFDYVCGGHGIVVRVMSSVDKRSRVSRAKSKDAIRVFAVDTWTGKGWIKTTRVYRTPGWCKNLRNAVMKVYNQSAERYNNSKKF